MRLHPEISIHFNEIIIYSKYFREDDWKSDARMRLKKFEEELQSAFEAGIRSYSALTVWSFINSVLYCITVVTTIGNDDDNTENFTTEVPFIDYWKKK